MVCEAGKSHRGGLTLAAAVDEGEGEERTDGVVELVRRLLPFGCQLKGTRAVYTSMVAVLRELRRLDEAADTATSSSNGCPTTPSCSTR